MKPITRFVFAKYGGKVITKKDFKKTCSRFNESPEYIINYYISRGYIIRILRGVYYVKTLEEYQLGKTPDLMRLIAMAMKERNIEWYFGLYTALRLNDLTQKYRSPIFVINSKITRSNPIKILGESVQFVKMKETLIRCDYFRCGVEWKGDLMYSNLEKTLLDFMYIGRYNKKIKAESVLRRYLPLASRWRLLQYAEYYPKSVQKEVKRLVSHR